jgi:hypothetical protein
MAEYILILTIFLNTQSGVAIGTQNVNGFTQNSVCEAAAKAHVARILAEQPNAKVAWSCGKAK